MPVMILVDVSLVVSTSSTAVLALVYLRDDIQFATITAHGTSIISLPWDTTGTAAITDSIQPTA